jgi:hypothetical protein
VLAAVAAAQQLRIEQARRQAEREQDQPRGCCITGSGER